MTPRRLSIAIASFLCLDVAAAGADGIELHSAAAGATSSWEGDSAVLSMGRIGYRLDDQLAIHLVGQGGYAGLGHRVLTAVGVGGQIRSRAGRARPYLLGAILRATEQPLENLADDPLGALLGTSDGVQHRVGLMGGAGVQIPVARTRGLTVFVSAEAAMTVFRDGGEPPSDLLPAIVPEDNQGPRSYLSLAVGIGCHFALPRRRRPR